MVPNIKDADHMSLRQLADAMTNLVLTALEGRTQPAEMSGGSITITNVGVFGVDTGTPILNPGEAAILCFGAVRQMPWVVRGKIKPRWVTRLGFRSITAWSTAISAQGSWRTLRQSCTTRAKPSSGPESLKISQILQFV